MMIRYSVCPPLFLTNSTFNIVFIYSLYGRVIKIHYEPGSRLDDRFDFCFVCEVSISSINRSNCLFLVCVYRGFYRLGSKSEILPYHHHLSWFKSSLRYLHCILYLRRDYTFYEQSLSIPRECRISVS